MKEWSRQIGTNTKQATAAYFYGEAAGWSGRYLESRHFRARLGTVLGWLVKKSPGLSILDYGCGSGVLLRELAGSHPADGGDDAIGV